jgi:hypothetical protein
MKVDYFGGCPTCGRNDVYLNSDLPWIFGANPFSSWRDETEAEERERVAPLWSGDAHHFVFVFNRRAIIDDATPRTVKQMADDLKDIAALVALAGERHDHSALPRCAVSLRRIADRLMREMKDVGIASDDDIPF